MALVVDAQLKGHSDPRGWFAGDTSEQDLLTLNELDGRDQPIMIALFNEEVVGV